MNQNSSSTSIDHEKLSLIEELNRIKAENEKLLAETHLKSAFLANMSHEIMTPLNAIVGFSQLLSTADEPEARITFAEIIKHNSDMLQQLIRDILDISKIEAGTLEYIRNTMDLNSVLLNIYQANKLRPHNGVALIYDNADSTNKLILNEDRNRISQVVINLINNAIKFTNEGTICFGYEVHDNEIHIYVKDTGIGIPADKLDKVFDRFVKLDNSSQGTGLGLPISQLIVSLFGGKIWVSSEVGKGTEFRFSIPFVKDKSLNHWVNEANASTVTKQNDNKAVEKKTILVAEDNYSNYMLLDYILRKDYNLLWAKEGDEAIKMYQQSNPDMILMDMKMPNINGIDATKLIRAMSPDIPIIFVSANAFEADRAKALEAGANDFVTKPVIKAKLLELIKSYLS